MNLTEADFEWLDRIGVTKERMNMIRANREKANDIDGLMEELGCKDWDEYGVLFTKLSEDARKLPELERKIQSLFYDYDTAFKKHKDIDDFKIAQVLSTLINKEYGRNETQI